VLGRDVTEETERIVTVDLPDDYDLSALQKKLGGTIKIATLIKKLPAKTDAATILYNLVEYLVGLNQAKISFALGEVNRDHLEPLDVREVKTRLEENGIRARYGANSRAGAGAALLLHRPQFQEILVVNTPEAILLTHTRAVQDIDDWTHRDRHKPYADHKKGMLPPKLARIMVNLAGMASRERVLYDPFCGTGTILLEARLAGYERLIGSDLDVKAILGAGENLDWLAQEYELAGDPRLFTRDVSKVTPADLGPESVDVIVTEPFLGKQTPQDDRLPGIFRGLEKLYWGAFRRWQDFLTPGAVLVIVFPVVVTRDGKRYALDGLLDKLSDLGYNKKSQGLMYAREQARVRREICVFDWQGKQ